MNNTPPIIDTGAEATPPAFTQDPQAQQFVAPEPEKKGSVGTIVFAILFVLALAGAGFLFITGMDKDSQIDDLTKKNKDLTAQLAEKPEVEEKEPEVKGDITGELLAGIENKYTFEVHDFKKGLDGVSETMIMSLNEDGVGGFGRYYYREAPGAEWHIVAEGQAVVDCLYYDEGVAAAFGETLPCTAPVDEQIIPVAQPTSEDTADPAGEAAE